MIQLYDHNQTAYQSALNLLVETGKAAVVHPTGTGKSFIAFKLIEDNPDKSFVWLSLEAGFDYGTQVRPEEAAEEGERGGKSRHGKQFGGRVYFS